MNVVSSCSLLGNSRGSKAFNCLQSRSVLPPPRVNIFWVYAAYKHHMLCMYVSAFHGHKVCLNTVGMQMKVISEDILKLLRSSQKISGKNAIEYTQQYKPILTCPTISVSSLGGAGGLFSGWCGGPPPEILENSRLHFPHSGAFYTKNNIHLSLFFLGAGMVCNY